MSRVEIAPVQGSIGEAWSHKACMIPHMMMIIDQHHDKDDKDARSPVMQSMVKRAKERKLWPVADSFKVVRVDRPRHHLIV